MEACVTETPCPDGYRELSTAELRELLQDEAKMEQIIRIDHKLQNLQVERENLLSSNRSLAELSLAKRPHLNSGKVTLSNKYHELSNLATSCWEKQGQLEARGHTGTLQSLHNRLQEEVVQAEETSEELLEKFMDSSLPLDDFLDSFAQSRRIYHVRRAQAEKLQELTRSGPPKPSPPSPATPPQDQQDSAPERPNGLPHPPLRVFQVRYGLTPAILVPHCSPQSPTGQAPLPPPPAAVGLRLIGQLPGGWASGRAVRVQQLYRPSPTHSEPPCR